jgi:hypothetical protein
MAAQEVIGNYIVGSQLGKGGYATYEFFAHFWS